MFRRTRSESGASDSADWTVSARTGGGAEKRLSKNGARQIVGAPQMNPRNFFAELKRRSPRFQTLLKASIAARKTALQ